MKGMRSNAELWGAQTASLHRPAACRAEVQRTNFEIIESTRFGMFSASCRKLQAGSLRSPEL